MNNVCDGAERAGRPEGESATRSIAELAAENERLRQVASRLLEGGIEYAYGYDEVTDQKGYFVGTEFVGPERDAIIDHLLKLQSSA